MHYVCTSHSKHAAHSQVLSYTYIYIHFLCKEREREEEEEEEERERERERERKRGRPIANVVCCMHIGTVPYK